MPIDRFFPPRKSKRFKNIKRDRRSDGRDEEKGWDGTQKKKKKKKKKTHKKKGGGSEDPVEDEERARQTSSPGG